jgi:hypothetical protein
MLVPESIGLMSSVNLSVTVVIFGSSKGEDALGGTAVIDAPHAFG